MADFTQLLAPPSAPGSATAQDSPDVQNAAIRSRQQAQADAALQLEQGRAMMEQTRNQQQAAQTGRALASQGASGDAAQWAGTPAYAGQSWTAAPAEAKQHFMDAYSQLPQGGNGIAEQLPEIWNEAQRNATGNPEIGLENLQSGQTAQVKMNGTPIAIGKPPKIQTDPATGKLYQVDPSTGEASYVQIHDNGAQGPLGEPALTGDDYLQSIDPTDAAHVKAIAEGRESPHTFSTRNNQQARIQAMVQQYDPTADAATLIKRQATVRAFSPAGNNGQAIRSGNTAIAHLNALADTIPGLHNSSVQGWNEIANPIAKQLLPADRFNTAQGQFTTEATAVADELSKFFGGKGGTTVQSVKDWHDKLNPNAPPETIRGNIESAIKLLASQMDNYRTTYEAGLGKSKNIPFIYPETQKILDQLQQKGVNTSAARAIDADLPQGQQPAAQSATPGQTPPPVRMQAPDGTILMVPAQNAAAAQKRGAKPL